MASLHIYATEDEVVALNKLENALTASGMTIHATRFVLAADDPLIGDEFESPDELLVYVYFDEVDYETKSGLGVLQELRRILDLAGWIAAEKLGLKERLLGFAEITNPLRRL